MVRALDISTTAAAAVNVEHFTPLIGMEIQEDRAMKNTCAVSSTQKHSAPREQPASSITIAIDTITFIKALYPRLGEDDATIERYRVTIGLLPPIVAARRDVLVDGFHRWQPSVSAHRASFLLSGQPHHHSTSCISSPNRTGTDHSVQPWRHCEPQA